MRLNGSGEAKTETPGLGVQIVSKPEEQLEHNGWHCVQSMGVSVQVILSNTASYGEHCLQAKLFYISKIIAINESEMMFSCTFANWAEKC